jgi:hypothetical protein
MMAQGRGARLEPAFAMAARSRCGVVPSYLFAVLSNADSRVQEIHLDKSSVGWPDDIALRFTLCIAFCY